MPLERAIMKKIVTVTEVAGEGLEGLLGENVTLFCANYIYTGKLEGVNTSCVKLAEAAIVYETGPFLEPKWKDAQRLPNPVYVQLAAIESFTVLSKA
jgi:hypothetical protein